MTIRVGSNVIAGGGAGLPSQSGQSGKFLTTDGTDASWATVGALPSQTGQSGKFLTTDGTDASWANVSTRNIGEIVASTIPLTDAGLHLLDGALLQGSGAYGNFVSYMAELYDEISDYWIDYVQPINPSGVTSTSGFSNPSNAFDNDSSTYASCGTLTDYIEWDLGQTLKVSGFNAQTQYISSVARACNVAIYSVDSEGTETLLANGAGVSDATSGTSSAIFTEVEVNKLRFKVIAASGGEAPATQYPSRIVQINIIAKEAIKPCFCSEAEWQQAVTDYGVCGKFVYDSTNNTVRLPKITGFTEGAIDATVLGDLVEAGLPNIEGYYYESNPSAGGAAGTDGVSGALYNKTFSSVIGNYSSPQGNTNKGIGFDASLSNSIYGNSTTVQPQSIKVLYYIVIATIKNTQVEVDINQVMTDVNAKVDKEDLAPCHVIIETYKNGTSWYRLYDDGWCEQGGVLSSTPTNTDVNLLKNYIDTNYGVLLTSNSTSTSSTIEFTARLKTISSFQIGTSATATGCFWQACGYIE